MTENFNWSHNQSKPPAADDADNDKISTHSKIKNFLEEKEETKNNNSCIERCCCCHCCTDLRTTKILYENFRLGVVLGFGH